MDVNRDMNMFDGCPDRRGAGSWRCSLRAEKNFGGEGFDSSFDLVWGWASADSPYEARFVMTTVDGIGLRRGNGQAIAY